MSSQPFVCPQCRAAQTNWAKPCPHAATLRQWWYLYAQVMREPKSEWIHELNGLTDQLEKIGIVKNGVPMPRTGAEDLASEVDRIRQDLLKKNMTDEPTGFDIENECDLND